jgi:hypothetical protein
MHPLANDAHKNGAPIGAPFFRRFYAMPNPSSDVEKASLLGS